MNFEKVWLIHNERFIYNLGNYRIKTAETLKDSLRNLLNHRTIEIPLKKFFLNRIIILKSVLHIFMKSCSCESLFITRQSLTSWNRFNIFSNKYCCIVYGVFKSNLHKVLQNITSLNTFIIFENLRTSLKVNRWVFKYDEFQR